MKSAANGIVRVSPTVAYHNSCRTHDLEFGSIFCTGTASTMSYVEEETWRWAEFFDYGGESPELGLRRSRKIRKLRYA